MNKLLPILLGVLVLGALAGVMFMFGDDGQDADPFANDTSATRNKSDDSDDNEGSAIRRNESSATSPKANNDNGTHPSSSGEGSRDNSTGTGSAKTSNTATNSGSHPARNTPANREGVTEASSTEKVRTPSNELPFAKASSAPRVVKPSVTTGSANEDLPQMSDTLKERSITPTEERFASRSNDSELRVVKGKVVERRDGTLIPLKEVLVADQGDKHRTYTKEDGSFEFEALFKDQVAGTSKTRNTDPEDDMVFLKAVADGYSMEGTIESTLPGQTHASGKWFQPNEVNAENGVLIVLEWKGLDEVTIRVENLPPRPEEVRVVLESYEPNGAFRDDPFFISGQLSREGIVTFKIPPRQQIRAVAYGQGVSAFAFLQSRTFDGEKKQYVLTLTHQPTLEFRGRIVNRRDGLPIAGARVYCEPTQAITYTNSKGEYQFWSPVLEKFQILHVDHLGFISVSQNLRGNTMDRIDHITKDPTQIPVSDPVGGPYLIKMRPKVHLKATIQTPSGHRFRELFSGRAVNGLSENVSIFFSQDASGISYLETWEFPWGTEQISFNGKDASNNSRSYKIDIPPEAWTEADTYTFNFITDRD